MDLITPLAFLLQTDQPNGLFGILPPLLMIFAVIYFLMIRPQQKKEKARQAMLGAMRKNDRIVTSGGIHGTVVGVRDHDITVRVDETNNIRVRFARDAIVRILRDDEAEGE